MDQEKNDKRKIILLRLHEQRGIIRLGLIRAEPASRKEVNMKQLVRLWQRPSHDGKKFKYYLIYTDEQGKRRQKSLGHADHREAKRRRTQLERELCMGIVEPDSMKLSELLENSLARTRGQVRESTLRETRRSVQEFIDVIGDMDYQRVSHQHGERFLQICLDKGNAPATAAKKLRHIKRVFQLAVNRGQLEKNPLKYVKSPKTATKSHGKAAVTK